MCDVSQGEKGLEVLEGTAVNMKQLHKRADQLIDTLARERLNTEQKTEINLTELFIDTQLSFHFLHLHITRRMHDKYGRFVR